MPIPQLQLLRDAPDDPLSRLQLIKEIEVLQPCQQEYQDTLNQLSIIEKETATVTLENEVAMQRLKECGLQREREQIRIEAQERRLAQVVEELEVILLGLAGQARENQHIRGQQEITMKQLPNEIEAARTRLSQLQKQQSFLLQNFEQFCTQNATLKIKLTSQHHHKHSLQSSLSNSTSTLQHAHTSTTTTHNTALSLDRNIQLLARHLQKQKQHLQQLNTEIDRLGGQCEGIGRQIVEQQQNATIYVCKGGGGKQNRQDCGDALWRVGREVRIVEQSIEFYMGELQEARRVVGMLEVGIQREYCEIGDIHQKCKQIWEEVTQLELSLRKKYSNLLEPSHPIAAQLKRLMQKTRQLQRN